MALQAADIAFQPSDFSCGFGNALSANQIFERSGARIDMRSGHPGSRLALQHSGAGRGPVQVALHAFAPDVDATMPTGAAPPIRKRIDIDINMLRAQALAL